MKLQGLQESAYGLRLLPTMPVLQAAGNGGSAAVPDLKSLPPQVLEVVQKIYGDTTAQLFLVGAPFAVLALLTVLFIKEKPLHTISGMDRMAKEDAETGDAAPPMPIH